MENRIYFFSKQLRKILSNLRFFLKQIRINQKTGTSYSQLKYFSDWRGSFQTNSSSVNDEQPWITYDAINFLKSHVTDNSKIFEYGGGGSTLFFVKRAAEVITVEHDKEWFDLLSQIIIDKKYSNWEGEFIPYQKGNIVPNPDNANPLHYSSQDREGYNFKEYASFIDNFTDNYFDIVLVDGRSRASCVKHSLNKIKSGGFLILDNSDRTYYLEQLIEIVENSFELIIDNFGACPYCNSFTKTSVYRKK